MDLETAYAKCVEAQIAILRAEAEVHKAKAKEQEAQANYAEIDARVKKER
jgi:hypothetical protein